MPELAVLSAMAHPELDVAHAIYGLPQDASKLYLDLVINALPEALRAMLEVKVIKNYEYKSDFARRYVEQGRDEGRREMARDTLLAVAGTRLGGLSKADVELIASLDVETAVAVHAELARTTTEAEGRAIFDRLVASRS